MDYNIYHEDGSMSIDAPGWDNYVNSHPLSSFYHLYNWKMTLGDVFGFKPFYIYCKEGSNIRGICPLFLMKDVFLRRYLISSPFANFAGIISDSQEVEGAIIDYIHKLSQGRNVQYAQLRNKENFISDDYNNVLAKDYFVTMCLDLVPTEAGLWERISPRNKNKIRLGEKMNFHSALGAEYLEAFHFIFKKNMRHLGTPAFPIRFFREILKHFPQNSNIFVVKDKERVVSGMFLFWFKDTIAEPWVSSLREYNKYYINNFLYWEAIKFAINNKFRYFDFGRSTRDSGTYNFKRQWGAYPVTLRYQHLLNRASSVYDTNSHSNKYGIFIKIWKSMPGILCDFIGPRLVKYLPEL